MNVLSLCDGMSCGQISLEKAGITVENYYASEIKKIGIKVTKQNYPKTIHIGDINKIKYKNGILYTEFGEFKTNIDLVMFGSPCQSFSIAMSTKNRVGLKDKEKSGLFYECYRVLQEVNPKYFLMENVASMKNRERDYITSLMKVEPIMINSSIIAPCMRKRYYWTNIPKVCQPLKFDISFNNILENGWSNLEKARCLLVSDSRPLTTPVKMFHRYYKIGFTNLIFKTKEHYEQCIDYYNQHYKDMKSKDISVGNIDIFNGVRYMNKSELERCQTVPTGYTECLTRNEAADVLGDGWTVNVIAWIFSFLPQN